jgi:hypothetical protein
MNRWHLGALGWSNARSSGRSAALAVLVVLASCGDGPSAAPRSSAGQGGATLTTVDDYGREPTIDAGTREEICRGGAAANRPGRVLLAAFIAERWPEIEGVLGFECREITLAEIAGCDGEVEPVTSECWSTHASGRAIDVVVGGEPNVPTPEGIALGDEIATAFLAERDGVAHYLARVTGVQEIIWNDRCWRPDSVDVVRAEDMVPCSIPGHDNHVHLTLSSTGADAETSWYEGR